MRVSILNVGHGDAAIIDFPGGCFGLVDFGDSVAGRGIVAPEVEKRKNQGSAFLFAAISHTDHDHIGGLPVVFDVMEPKYLLQSTVGVELFEEWYRFHGHSGGVAALKRLRESSTRRKRFGAGTVFWEKSCPTLKLVSLSPDCHVEQELVGILQKYKPGDDAVMGRLAALRNRSSLSLYFQFEESSLVLLGENGVSQADFIWEEIQEIPNYVDPMVVKLAHHGSAKNNTLQLLSRIGRPGTLMPVSSGGIHRLPDPEVLSAVQEIGCVNACTCIGASCSLLIQRGECLEYQDVRSWREKNKPAIAAAQKSGAKCCGNIDAVVGPGQCLSAMFELEQGECPFGGAKSTTYVLKR